MKFCKRSNVLASSQIRLRVLITGWAVALTCCISHSAKHRKMADFDHSGSQNPWSDFDETWHGWLRPGPHPIWQLWWGSEMWVVWANMWLVKSLTFFSFFLLFLLTSPRAQVAFLDRAARYMRLNACVRPRVCLLGSRQYRTTFRGFKRPKTSPKSAGIGISQPNRQISKIAIYPSPMKIFASNFTDRFSTCGTIKKCKITSNGIVKGRVTYFWNFGTL